jgi:flagellar hook-associated protein 1 FlgK
MSDLFSSLTMAARSLQAQQMGLDVVGQNIANANTDGFSRRQIVYGAVAPTDKWSAGGGVSVQDVRASRDALLERRLRLETPAQGRDSAIADTLQVVQAALGKSGQSIDGELAAFFDAFALLAEDPTSATSRQGVLQQGEALAGAFSGMADRLAVAQKEADTGVRGIMDEVNALADRIAALNDSIARAGGNGPATLGLRDELTTAVRELSQLVEINALDRDDGGMDVTVGSGRALVVGNNAYKLSVVQDSRGYAQVKSGDAIITGEIAGGEIGGLLYARDTLVPGYLLQLDTLAYTVATEVNNAHAGGYDLAGTTGRNFFAPLTAVAGAASSVRLDPGIAGYPDRVAAASTTSTGDNGNARVIAALRDARLLDGGTATATDSWASLVYSVGLDAATAKAELANREEIVRQLAALRESVSGVSLDEEAMMMMKFQRAYEANARYFQAIDSAINTLMSLAGN